MRFLAAIVAVPVLVFGWQAWRDHSLELRLAPIASGVAGVRVEVDCQSVWGDLLDVQWREGEVRFDASGRPERKLFMTRRICERLRTFARHGEHRQLACLRSLDWSAADPLPLDSTCYAQSANTIYAILILAHESYHTAGVSDEATTNCFAIQAMAWTAAQLGASLVESEAIAHAMEALEPKQGSGYATNDCHAGRRLDLHPETPQFPTELPLAPPLGRGARSTLPS